MNLVLTPKQRYTAGQQRRKDMRRLAHAAWPVKLRKMEPLELLKHSMLGRVPALISLKYERMAESPYSFFRGAVPVMAYDLSILPNTGLMNQICGDAHIRNLGAFAAPDGRLVFDINDFDETVRAPFEWDVKRLATSLVLAARHGGSSVHADLEAAEVFLGSYCHSIQSLQEMTVIDIAHFQVHRLRGVKPVSLLISKAERATPLHTLETLTQTVSSRDHVKHGKAGSKHARKRVPRELASSLHRGQPAERVFKSAPPLLDRVTGKTAQDVLDSLIPYRESLQPERRHFLDLYKPVDVAFKVVGTGSIALRDYCIYLEGNGPGDPLFLQIKEERESAYAPYLKLSPASAQHQGHRVVDGQRAMQLQSDPFLGWTSIDGRDYLVRQLNDHKASLDIEDLSNSRLKAYASICGEILARGHARAGDACALAGYLGKSGRFEQSIVKFASSYANQTERDWKELVRRRKK